MSATVPLVKSLLKDQSGDAATADLDSNELSLADIEAAAKRGAAEALAESQRAETQSVDADTNASTTESESSGGLPVKRFLGLCLVLLYVLRRRRRTRRTSPSDDTK
jgi:MYXO-CTERM domain-containing protein